MAYQSNSVLGVVLQEGISKQTDSAFCKKNGKGKFTHYHYVTQDRDGKELSPEEWCKGIENKSNNGEL